MTSPAAAMSPAKHRSALACLALVLGVLAVAGCSNEAAFQRHMEAGERFLAAGKLSEAIIEFRNAVDRDELSGEARFALANAYEANGNYEQAMRQFVRAADLLPDDVAAQLKAATYLLLGDHFEEAETRARRALAIDAGNVEAQILLGNALAGLKDVDGAIAQIGEAIALDPERSESYTSLGMIHLTQGKREEARAAFEKGVAIAPSSSDAWLALANFEWSTGDVAAAERSLERAYALDKTNLLTNRVLASFYIAVGRAAEAEPHLKVVAERAEGVAPKLALADFYIRSRRYDEARRVLDALPQTHDQVVLRMAGLAYATGDKAEGHRRIDEILKAEPNHAAALLMKARWLLSEGRHERALRRAQLAVAANPQSATAFYLRGLAEMDTYRTTEAMKSFSEVLRLNPRATAALVQLSHLHLARNSIDSAVLYAEEAIANAPMSVDARLALVRAWVARGDLTRAEGELAILKRVAPDLASLHALDGSLRLAQGRRDLARAAFERALQLDSTSFEALTGLVTLDVADGRLAAARARVEPRVGPDAPADVLLLAAKAYIAEGNLAKGEELLRRVIENEPLHPSAYSLLGAIFTQQGRLDAALAEFDARAAADPQDVASRLAAAMIVHAQGDLEAATRRYEAVLRLEPQAAIAANNLAAIYADAGENLEVALQLAESAASQLPAHPEIQDTLGWIYYHRHRLGEAIRRFEQSVALAPENPRFHYHLGLALAKSGDAEQARKALEEAVRLDPRLTEAQTALASLSH